MRLRCLLGRVLVGVLALAAAAAAQEVQRIAAVVNDNIISVQDLEARIALVVVSAQLEDRPETRRRLAPQVLRSLIDEQLKMQEAKRLAIQVTKPEIDRVLTRIEEQNRMPKGGLDAFLEQNRVKKSALITQVEAELAWGKIVQRQARANVRISDEEIDDVLADIEASRGKPEQLVAEIFLAINNPKEEPDVVQLADRLIQQLRAGTRFEAIAQNFSQSATAAVGGDLGWVRAGQLPADLEVALARLQPGQISPPIRAADGLYVLFLRDRRQSGGSADEVVIGLRQLFLPLAPTMSEADRAAESERARAFAARATGCAAMDALAKEIGNPLSGDLGRVTLGTMPAPIRAAVERLNVGQASAPLVMGDGVLVLMVCERESGAARGVARQQIERMLSNQRTENASRQLLRDLRRSAYVDVRI